MSAHPAVASVNALDAGGGAGLTADAQVFAELDCRALCVATSVLPSEPLASGLLARQLEAARGAAPIAAVKIGFVKGREQVDLLREFVTTAAPETSVVSWSALDAETRTAMLEGVVPLARVVVVRAFEALRAAGRDAGDIEDLRAAARELRDRGARSVVVCGLLVRGRVIDLLDDGGEVAVLDTAKIHAARIDGLDGSHVAALAAHLGRGLTLRQATDAAQRYVGFRLRRGR